MGEKEHQAKRIQTSIIYSAEKKTLLWIAPRLPRWVTSDMLTLVGFLGAVVMAIGYGLSNLNIQWLWLACFGLFLNWFGDSLDGTLARVRGTQRKVYGFYIDHTVDAINEAFMFLGAGMSPFMRFDIACVLLVVYLMLTLNVSMNAHLKGEFRLTYAKLGPTEFRLICIIACFILMFAPGLREIVIEMPWFGGVLSLCLLDIIGVVILLALVVIYLVTIIQDARYYAKIDPKHKNE